MTPAVPSRPPPSPIRAHLLFAARIVLAAGLLVLILRLVDLDQLRTHLSRINLPLLGAAFVVLFLIPVMISAWRWHALLRRLYGVRLPYLELLRRFWISMAVGYFTPSSVGTDLYRVLWMTSRAVPVERAAAVVVLEKPFLVLGTGLMIMLTYPLVASHMAADALVTRSVELIYIFGLGALGALVLLAFTGPGRRVMHRMLHWLGHQIGRVAESTGRRTAGHGGIVEALHPFLDWRSQALVTGFGMLNQAVGGVGGFLLLLALNTSLPVTVHLFVWTLMTFAFILPVTVGGIGVREATFILLFGLFGVPREVALAASFVAFTCMLASLSIGGGLWLTDGTRRPRPAPAP